MAFDFDAGIYDLYIRISLEMDIIYRIQGLSFDDARDLAFEWSETGYAHDCLIYNHKSSPKSFIGTNVIDKSREWFVDLIASKGALELDKSMHTRFAYVVVSETYDYSLYPTIKVEYVGASERNAWNKIQDILKAKIHDSYTKTKFIPYGAVFGFNGVEYSMMSPKHIYVRIKYTIHRKQFMTGGD